MGAEAAATTKRQPKPKAPPYVPPPDPDFKELALAGWRAWKRDSPGLIAFDTETTGVAHFDVPFCVTAAWRSPHTGDIEAHYFELTKFDSRKAIQPMLEQNGYLVGHNVKFDLQKVVLDGLLQRDGLHHDWIADTEALAHLLNEHRPKGLKDLMVSVLGWQDNVEVEIKSGPRKGEKKLVPREKYELDMVRRKLKVTKDDGFHVLPRAVVVPYAVMDAKGTFALFERFMPEMEKHPDLLQLYRDELELTLVLLDMERAGLGVVEEYVSEQVLVYRNKLVQHDFGIERIVGKPVRSGKMTAKERPNFFNPDSSDEIKAFFTERGHVHDSYDKAVLKSLPHPLAGALLERRKDAKLLNTYFLAMQNEARNGVLHPSFRQHGTKTGRMSSGEAEG